MRTQQLGRELELELELLSICCLMPQKVEERAGPRLARIADELSEVRWWART